MNDFADERKLWTGLRLSASSLVLCRNVTIQIRRGLGLLHQTQPRAMEETRQPGSGKPGSSGPLSAPHGLWRGAASVRLTGSFPVDAHHHYQRDFRIGQHHYSTFLYRSLKRKASRDVHSARGHKFTVKGKAA